MYRVLTSLTIQQIPSPEFKNRNRLLTVPGITAYSGASTWESLTQTLKITIPKNIKITATDENGNTYSLASVNKSIGGYVGQDPNEVSPALSIPEPTFMRGDLVTFNIGWRATLQNGNEQEYMTGGNDPTGIYPGGVPKLYQGFISKVSPRMPFVIELEDAMWLLKQIPTPVKQWPGQTLQQICSSLLDTAMQSNATIARYKNYGINLTVLNTDNVSQGVSLVFNVQNLWTKGESMALFLNRIKSHYKIYSYFRNYELRVGMTYYVASDAVTQSFTFQQNILDNDRLNFVRKDDTVLSVVVRSHYNTTTNPKTGESYGTTKDGQQITREKSTEILVYVDTNNQFQAIEKKPGVDYPLKFTQEIGQRFDLEIFDAVTDVNKLKAMGVTYLKKYYYDGLKGSFTTFGVPFVKHGDVIQITNPLLPEMNGKYMCKSVEPYGGAEEEGLFQNITLDYKINTVNDINSYIF